MNLESIATYSERESDSDPHRRSYASGENSPSSPKSPFSERSGKTGSTQGLLPQNISSKHGPSNGHGLAALDCRPEATDVDEGWPLLAKLMDKEPEFEAFARFRELQIKNLLYYQVEIDYLGHKLEDEELWDRDVAGGDDNLMFHKNPSRMVHSSLMSDSSRPNGKSRQWEMVLRLRDSLRGYNEALIQYAKVSSLPEPSSLNMSELVKWICMTDHGNFTVQGRGSKVWGDLFKDDEPAPGFKKLFGDLWTGILRILCFWQQKDSRVRCDLVAPRPDGKADAVANWIALAFLPWMAALYTRIRKVGHRKTRDEEGGHGSDPTSANNEKDKQQTRAKGLQNKQGHINLKLSRISLVQITTVSKVTSFIASIVACVLPTAAIGVLTTSAADSNLQKLLWIGGFTMLFSMGLTAFTRNVSRVQIFMAAAAFSAVLVVFIHT